jgi:hypothetical protein
LFSIFAPVEMTELLKVFIREHAEDDVLQLVLNASRYKDVDVRFAAGQIEARRRIKDKLPSWYANDCLIYPSLLAAEQCSSEQTALYKQRLIDEGDRVCDLTGGLGVDAYFLSLKGRDLVYVERNALYCDVAACNMKQLGARNIRILNDDAMAFLVKNPDALSGINVIYLDPARRGSGKKRVFAPEDCEPDLTELWPLLCRNRRRIIVKLSPMLDISNLLSRLPAVREIHIVSVRNDCKELLAVADTSCVPDDTKDSGTAPGDGADVQIYCVNSTVSGKEQSFHFRYGEEKAAVAAFAGEIGRYLYEPNVSILKAGAYKTVSSRYGIEKLHTSSHLYTSDSCLPSFAGRIFEVSHVYKFDNRLCRNLSAQIPRANMAVRNFPLSVDELRKRTRIADGGDVYLFASTLSGNRKVLVECRKIHA